MFMKNYVLINFDYDFAFVVYRDSTKFVPQKGRDSWLHYRSLIAVDSRISLLRTTDHLNYFWAL